jgi:hypothetical protein
MGEAFFSKVVADIGHAMGGTIFGQGECSL